MGYNRRAGVNGRVRAVAGGESPLGYNKKLSTAARSTL